MHLRTMALLTLLALLASSACDDEGGPSGSGHVALLPEPGLPRYQELGAIFVPGGVVSPAGGNFLHRRVDFTIDTLLGTRAVGAVYNTADDAWRWSWEFELWPTGVHMVDPTGAVYDFFSGPQSADNRLFPGARWVRVDGNHIKSLGGLVHEFHPTGKLAAIYWQSADYPRLAYRALLPGGVGPLARVEQCITPVDCELVYQVERDGSGRVTALEDRTGRRAVFIYDSEGRLANARDPLDLANAWPGRTYTWWGPHLASITNSEGERIEYETRWANGQLTSVRQVGTPPRVHRFSYDPVQGARPMNEPSRAMHHRDPEGHVTTIHVDGHRRARSVRRPSGATTSYEYTGTSFELSAITAADGTRTEWNFSGETLVNRIEPSGNVVVMDVRLDGGENRANPFARPIERVEDDLGLIEEREYDAQGRLLWAENGAGERTAITYDSANQIASVTPAHGVSIQFSSYGAHGHPETVTTGGEIATRSFDAVGNLLSETGRDLLDTRPGGEHSRVYDADRNAIRLTVASSDPQVPIPTLSEITTTFRSDGRAHSVQRPFGGDHEFLYDATGELVERREWVDGAWQATLYERDRLGQLTAETLPNGMRRERDYTVDGQLAAVRSLNVAVLETDATLTWVDGRLATIDDTAYPAAETIGYDAAGRPSVLASPSGDSLEIAYDLRGRRTGETYRLDGGSVLRTLGYGYDGAGRETTVEDGGVALIERSFRDGRADETEYANGLTAGFGYDAITGLPDTRTLSDASGVVAFSSVTHSVSPADTAVTVAASTSSPLTTTSEMHHLGLDAASGAAGKRLLRSGSDDLVFDTLSNLLQRGTQSYNYNPERNRLVSVTDTTAPTLSYVSDSAGFVTTRDGVAIAWTAAGQIAAIGSDTFEYDAMGRPTRRVIGGVERRTAFGGRVETDAAGTPVRIDLAAVSLELDTGDTRYRHLDYRGNVDLITDDLGDVVAHYEYDAYGVLAMTGQDDGTRTFAGGRLVQGLVVLGSRVHDPVAGRFLAPDPIFQLATQFAYTTGNPVWWWDASGLESSPAARYQAGAARAAGGATLIAIGAVAGAVLAYAGLHGVAAAVAGGLITVGANALVNGLAEMAEAQEEAASRASQSPDTSTHDPGGSGGGPGGAGVAPAPSVPTSLNPDPGCAGCSDLSGGTFGTGIRGGFGVAVGGFGGGFGGF